MTARVVIAMQGVSEAISIPVTAVVSDGTGVSRVWVYDPEAGTVHGREVVIGVLSGSQVEILSGLEDGDTIAVLGANTLTEGMKVRPQGD
jgi:multidrug efflux pump subunit AcrA (membrane-fusion protein)